MGEERELQIVAFAKTGKGSEHSKFSPGLMYYRHVVEIKMDADLYERIKELLPNNEIKKEGKSIIILDNQKKEVSDICEEICREEGKKLEMIPKNELIITIESFGQIEVNEIFKRAISAFEKDLEVRFQKNLILYIFKKFLFINIIIFLYAGIAKWSNARDSRSRLLVSSEVRILFPAFMKKFHYIMKDSLLQIK